MGTSRVSVQAEPIHSARSTCCNFFITYTNQTYKKWSASPPPPLPEKKSWIRHWSVLTDNFNTLLSAILSPKFKFSISFQNVNSILVLLNKTSSHRRRIIRSYGPRLLSKKYVRGCRCLPPPYAPSGAQSTNSCF